MADNTKQKEKRSPIFSITIEIAQEKHHLHIFKYDTPSQIAYRFCIQNNWDLACVTPVSKKIQEVFEEYLRNPDLEHKLRKKLEQIIPNDSQNSLSFSQKQIPNIKENNIKVQEERINQIEYYEKDQLEPSQRQQMIREGIDIQLGDKYDMSQIKLVQQDQQQINNEQTQYRAKNVPQIENNFVTPVGQNKMLINIDQRQENIQKSLNKNESDQKIVIKNESNSTLQSNSTISRKYFNCNHITNHVQQKVIQKIDDKKQSTDQKKRSISLDNTSSQSHNNFKYVPQLQYNQMSKDSSSNHIQFSDIMSVPFKDANSIQFKDAHSIQMRENPSNIFKENLTDSRSQITNFPTSKGQNSNGKNDPYSKILRESQQQNGQNETVYFKGLKESLSSSQTYANALKEFQQKTKQDKKRESHSNGSRERLSQNIQKENTIFRDSKNTSYERINIKQQLENTQKLQQDFIDQGTLLSRSLGRKSGIQSSSQQKKTEQIQSGSVSPSGVNSQTLYERGVYFLDQKKSKIDQFKQNRWDRIMSTCTFIPKTNQRANDHLLQYRDKTIDPYDQLYQNSKVIQMKKEIIKNKMLTEESKEFSFKPALNPISKLIVKTKRQNSITDNTPNFETQKNTKITQIKQEMLKECTFHPQISKNSEKLRRTHNPNLNVYDRLYISTNKKNKKQNDLSHNNHEKNNYQFITYPDQEYSSNCQHVQNSSCQQCGSTNPYLSTNYSYNLNANNNPQNNYNNFSGQFINVNNSEYNNEITGLGNNYYNPSITSNPNYSFSQDKINSTSYQQYQGNGNACLLSSDFFNNSEQAGDQSQQQNSFNNNGLANNQTSSLNNQLNNNQLNSSLNNQNYFSTNNQNTANNLSLLNQSDLVVSSTQMNGSQNFKQEQFTNQSLDNIYQPNIIQVQQQNQVQQQHQHTCSKSGSKTNKDNNNNNSFVVNKNQSVNSQGKKICCSSINTMQSSLCSQKAYEKTSHNESREKERNNKHRRESTENQYKKSFSPNKNSVALMEKKKRQRFEEIFILLDSDKDGLISAQNISIQELPDEILVIIAPLLYELEDMDAELTLLEFIDAFDRLYKQLPIIDKNKLLLFDTYQKWEQEKIYLHNKDLNFQPQINPHSEIIAQISRPERGNDNLYDLYKDRDRLCEEKLMQKRREKENEINQQCTFHPNLLQSNTEVKASKEPSQINSCQKSFQEFLSNHTKIV